MEKGEWRRVSGEGWRGEEEKGYTIQCLETLSNSSNHNFSGKRDSFNSPSSCHTLYRNAPILFMIGSSAVTSSMMKSLNSSLVSSPDEGERET